MTKNPQTSSQTPSMNKTNSPLSNDSSIQIKQVYLANSRSRNEPRNRNAIEASPPFHHDCRPSCEEEEEKSRHHHAIYF